MKSVMTIVPYKNVESFYFGQTPAETRKTNGKARREIKDNFMGIYIEERGGLELHFEEKKLFAVYFFKDAEPRVHGIDVFSENALEKLSRLDVPIIGKDRKYALFRELGLCVGGISGKKIPEKHLAVAFAKEHLPSFDVYVNT